MDHQVFLSYSTKDTKITEKMCNYLEQNGIHCWMAPRDILPGSEYGEAIIAGIEKAQAFVLVYSEHSNSSQHVLREVERCVSRNLPLVAFKIEDVKPTKSMEYFLMANQWLDASGAPEQYFGELLEVLRTLVNNENSGLKQSGAADSEKNTALHSGKKKYRIAAAAAAVAGAAVLAASVITLNAAGKKDGSQAAPGNTAETESRELSGADAQNSRNTSEQEQGKNAKNSNDAQNAGNQEEKLPLAEVSEGEYLTFGRYFPMGQENAGDGEISWIVLAVDQENNHLLLLSAELLDLKAYDVAESGVYYVGKDQVPCDRTKLEEYSNEQRIEFYGNSDWKTSNLRAWLNSEESKVEYEGQEPVSKGTDDGVNGYQTQPGFLYDFTKSELSRIVTTLNQTEGNPLAGGTVETEDRVFLLSAEEAEHYLDEQNISRYAAPTESAVAANRGTVYYTYQSYSIDTLPWYFRTPSAEHAGRICLAGSGLDGEADVIEKYACSAGYGVRPAMVIDISGCEITGDGTRTSPYILIQPEGE